MFNPLSREDIIRILDLVIEKMVGRIEAMGYKVKISDPAKHFLAEKGHDPEFWCPSAETCDTEICRENPVAEEILKQEINEGETIDVDYTERRGRAQIRRITQEREQT